MNKSSNDMINTLQRINAPNMKAMEKWVVLDLHRIEKYMNMEGFIEMPLNM